MGEEWWTAGADLGGGGGALGAEAPPLSKGGKMCIIILHYDICYCLKISFPYCLSTVSWYQQHQR